MILREYQQLMIDNIRNQWAAGHRRVLGVLPTGGGKTEVAIAILMTEATPDCRALVIVDRKVLTHQWADRLRLHGAGHVGILQGENTRAVYAPILVATAQTIRSRGVPQDVGLIVVDESHIWHKSHDDVLGQLGDARVLGLTATPLRAGLGLRFDTIVTGSTIRELTTAGHLVPAKFFAPAQQRVAEALETVGIRAGDFAINELSVAMSGKRIVGDVVGEWLKRGEDRQTIAFCVDKAHATLLAEEFMGAGVDVAVVVDETSDDARADIFSRFNRGDVRVLTSVGVLGVGFDSPIAACAIMARPTMSLSLYVQQGGRVLRPAPGKSDALVLDHAGNSVRHGLLIDFEPPSELSDIDESTDKKSRKDKAAAWVCRKCECVNDLADDICVGCGTARRRMSSLVVVDGYLRPVEHEPDERPAGITADEISDFYAQCLWYAEHKSLRRGWAWYATQRRFKVEGHVVTAATRSHIQPLTPSAEATRWFKADRQRQMIARRATENRHA